MAKKKKRALRKAKKGEKIRQVAAIPFRITADAELEVMLVTSRETQRFILPKGWPMKGRSGRKTAAIEALEEAGVEGKTLPNPAGTYSYWKRLPSAFVRVNVTVYLLEVTQQLSHWQEAESRKRAWLRPHQAATLIDEPELATLVRNLTLPAPEPEPDPGKTA